MNPCSCLRQEGVHHCADVILFIRNRNCAVCAYLDCKHAAELPLHVAGAAAPIYRINLFYYTTIVLFSNGFLPKSGMQGETMRQYGRSALLLRCFFIRKGVFPNIGKWAGSEW